MGLDCTLWQLPADQWAELMNSNEAVEALICGIYGAIKTDSSSHILRGSGRILVADRTRYSYISDYILK